MASFALFGDSYISKLVKFCDHDLKVSVFLSVSKEEENKCTDMHVPFPVVGKPFWVHRSLTLTQCEWILYESCHKFFMKATQILYAFCFAQHRVGESNSCIRTF